MQEMILLLMENQYEISPRLIVSANKLLEKEKEQIIKAYEDGADHGMDVIEDGLDYIHSTEYYNQTYNQNK